MTTDQTVLAEAEALALQLDQASTRSDWTESIAIAKRALDLIGHRYVVPQTIDETGMRLVLADAQERAGALPAAASIRRSVLDARLKMLRQKIGDHTSGATGTR